MAKGKQSRTQKASAEERFWEVLRSVAPRLMDTLMRYVGNDSQTYLASRTGTTANQISRYCRARAFPKGNLSTMVTHLGLREDTAWWLLGRALAEEFEYASLEASSQPSEIRQPRTPYDAGRGFDHELPEEIVKILNLDLSRLEPEERVQLTRVRQALRDQAIAHRTLVDDFKERYQAAVFRRRS